MHALRVWGLFKLASKVVRLGSGRLKACLRDSQVDDSLFPGWGARVSC